MRVIKQRLYKVTRYYGAATYVEAADDEEIAKYAAEENLNGHSVKSVSEIRLDGTHSKVAICKMDSYKKMMSLRGL